MEVVLTPYRAELFTAAYHLSGELHMRGAPGPFLNDHVNKVFTLVGGIIRPLARETAVMPVDVRTVHAAKASIEILGLPGAEPKDVQLMAAICRLVCFTESYVVEGEFHTGAETRPADVFYFVGGPFFPATNVRIRAVRPVASEVDMLLPLAYVHRDAVRALYGLDEEGASAPVFTERGPG